MLTRVIEIRICGICDNNDENPRKTLIQPLRDFFVLKGVSKGRSCYHDVILVKTEVVDGTQGIEFGPNPSSL